MDVVLTSSGNNRHIVSHAIRGLRDRCGLSNITVVVPSEVASNYAVFFRGRARILDESSLMNGFELEDVHRYQLPGFPRGAGWYYQQLLKYAFCLERSQTDFCLIWDGDTVPLQDIKFFDELGRPIYTQASEYHQPYFHNFERLLGFPAPQDFSYISQHMVIHREVLHEMLQVITDRSQSHEWPSAIMQSLSGDSSNLFSEYETYGNYLQTVYPGSFSTRSLSWTRHGARLASYHPTAATLTVLGIRYAFAAFERADRLPRRVFNWTARRFRP